jgi:hypothetical protein
LVHPAAVNVSPRANAKAMPAGRAKRVMIASHMKKSLVFRPSCVRFGSQYTHSTAGDKEIVARPPYTINRENLRVPQRFSVVQRDSFVCG